MTENIVTTRECLQCDCWFLFTQQFTLAFQNSFINFLIQQSGWRSEAVNNHKKSL